MRFAELPIVKDRRKNIILRKRIIELCSSSQTAQSEAAKRCRSDILFWVNYFGWTYDPRRKGSKAVPFITYDFQDRAILRIVDDVREGRDVVILKSRDMGASWINVLVPTWFTQFHPMNSFLMVSRNEDYVDAPNDPKSLFWKVRFLLKHQPRWLGIRNKKDQSMHIGNEDNGSVIDGESTTGEVGRGDRRTAILLDEFAAFETKNGYNALSATQSATNCRIFNSTPKGQNNAFYDVASNKANDIIRLHWSEHPEKNVGLYTSVRESNGRYAPRLLDDFHGIVEVRSKGEGGSRKVAYPDDYPFILDGKTRSPWYDLQCARAVTPQEIAQELDIDFAGSDYQFFDPIAVEHYKQNYCREPEARANVMVERSAASGTLSLEYMPDGHLSLFEMPKGGRWERDRRFVIGADVSAGTGASNSALAVYDFDSSEMVAELADPNLKPDDFARLTIVLARWFNFAVIVPDRTGPTGEVYVSRIKTDAPDLVVYRVQEINKVGMHVSDKEGVYLTSQTRTKVLMQYRDAIGNCRIINRSFPAMDESLAFICKSDGNIEHSAALNSRDPSGANSNHGDRVIANALANLAIAETFSPDIEKNIEILPGSLAWRMEQVKREESNRGGDSLGAEWAV